MFPADALTVPPYQIRLLNRKRRIRVPPTRLAVLVVASDKGQTGKTNLTN